MKTSQTGIDLIKHWESLHDGDLTQIGLQPKLCPAGIWTVGYGHAIIDPKTNKHIKEDTLGGKNRAYELFPSLTEQESEELLAKDLIPREKYVTNKLKVRVNQYQFDALVSHTYNTGGSDMMFTLINGKAAKIVIFKWFTRHYITANSDPLLGLMLRRSDEALLYFT